MLVYDLYFHKSPNTYKPTILLEELGVDYKTHLVHVGKGQQFSPEFVAISPNSKVPVLIDNEPEGGGESIVLFESGAILLYLSEKHGRFRGESVSDRAQVLKWLFWHCASQSPMNGQCAHFNLFRPENTYARERYQREVHRLAGVLDRRLGEQPYVAGADYSIADMACYPWFDRALVATGLEPLSQYANIAKWFDELSRRPGLQAAFDRFERETIEQTDLKEFAKNMFGHDAEAARLSEANARKNFVRMGMKLNDDGDK